MGARAVKLAMTMIAIIIGLGLGAEASADERGDVRGEKLVDERETPCESPQCGAELPGEYGGYVRSRIGRATAPFFTAAMSEVESQFTQALSFEIIGHFRLSPALVIGSRLPMAPSLVRQPAGSYLNKRVFGNPELFVDTQKTYPEKRRFALRLYLRAAIGAPLAGHGPRGSLTGNRALEVSNAMEGWQLTEHYTPGVLPLTARVRLEGVRGPLHVSAYAKLPVLVRIGDASLPDEANARPVAMVPHVGVGAAYWPASWFGVSARVTAVAQLPAPVEAPGTPVQLALEPRFDFALFDHVAIALEYWLPLGGPLSRTLAGGLSIGVYR